MAVKVTIFNNGPIRVEAPEGENFIVVDAEGKEFGLAGRTAIGLCRCGLSENKPFCDGMHGRHGFQSVCPARDLPPPKPKV